MGISANIIRKIMCKVHDMPEKNYLRSLLEFLKSNLCIILQPSMNVLYPKSLIFF